MQDPVVAEYIERFFPHFESPLRNLLGANCTLKSFAAGDSLMQTGQYFRATILIVEGLVKLYREHEDGGEYFMYYLHPGNACALSMICAAKQEKSELMAKAEEDSVVLLVPITMMDTLMTQYKSWYYFVLETYRSRFEELLEVIDHIAFKNMDERLGFYLSRLKEKQHTTELNITHQEIANDLNSSREVISRLLKKMEQQGQVKLGRNTVTVSD